MSFSDMACVAEETGLLVNLLEPMDLVLSFQFYMLVIPLDLYCAFCLASIKAGEIFLLMMRVKRRIWAGGQFVFGQLVEHGLGAFFAGKFSVD